MSVDEGETGGRDTLRQKAQDLQARDEHIETNVSQSEALTIQVDLLGICTLWVGWGGMRFEG